MFGIEIMNDSTTQRTALTQKEILYFWLPLASTWLMMSVEGPYLSALIARLPEAKINLAAYGISFSLAMIFEAPVIMMMSASTALVKDYNAYLQIKKFNIKINLILTFFLLSFNIPQIFYFVTENLIGLPKTVSFLSHQATLALIPFPASIGLRRFYQGILIRNNKTKYIALGTFVRLISMSLTALILYLWGELSGALVGGISLSSGVISEAVFIRIVSSDLIERLKLKKNTTENEFEILNQKKIKSFYIPLAFTSLLTIGIQPFVTFFVGQSRMPLESFAVLPVVTSFVFIFRAIGLSYQEVVVALIGNYFENHKDLMLFSLKLSLFLVAVLSAIAFSILSDIWFYNISGLSKQLSDFSKIPLRIMSFFPALTVLISYQRAVLVIGRKTKLITIGTAIEFATIILLMLFFIHKTNLVGAVSATLSFVIGRALACLYLFFPTIFTLRKNVK